MSAIPHRAARYELAHFGELVGDASRAAMLLSLMDGEHRPATELAALARITASTASTHLARLVAGGLLAVTQQGRHRYYRIANEQVAHALEVLAMPAPRATRTEPLAHARTCYKHLAGQVGVAWLQALEAHKLVHLHEGAPRLTTLGAAHFAGISPKTEGRLCLDWSERRHHLGGPLGVELTAYLFAQKWIARSDTRLVRITTAGERAFAKHFSLQFSRTSRR